jgi:hypothetical protein
MRRAYCTTLVLSAVALLPSFGLAQAHQMGDASHAVAGGGISAPGWTGKVDPGEAARGGALDQSKLTKEGDALHVVTGPAVSYWNPANTASGNYTVKATFKEPQFMGLNSHPHPYGVFIGGNDMGTDQQTLLYCEAYGDGRFIVRGFGPAPFMLNGHGDAAPSINKAAAKGEPVTQEIALSVNGDKVECAINGKVVGSYDKATVVTAGKLKSTDGVYGIRFAHNTEGIVTGLTMTKQ